MVDNGPLQIINVFHSINNNYILLLLSSESKPEVKQAPLPSAIPPSVQSSNPSTQLQFENISPAPPTTAKQPTTTAPLEPSRLIQTVDTSFSNSNNSVAKLSDVSSLSSAMTNAQYSNSVYGSTLSASQHSGIPLVTVGSYMTNLHYQGAQGLPMNTLYASQGYVPTTQGLTQQMQYQPAQLQPPQPAGFPPMAAAGGGMYGMPPGNMGVVQNPPNFGVSPGRGMGQSPLRPPPPTMPPSQMLAMQPGHPHARTEFTWPRQFGVPPQNQPPLRGGWMPR